ncbi:HNH endonuclease [Pseudanabaena sp. FACHB-2040]|uniref:HNH endonuclease n=1 Tax=Pseudanabaena sp. FACHB-2040 TaxID=2692859 RepID=UPI001684CEA3|nr:HNH endonuclease [Pseudanabaena sp. FACHB-2040]MBD2257822.1 HNH endonuclease [Pseudanabaena sp. FACHB-2040]
MLKDLQYYARKFAKLNVNRNRERGNAPHKPVLLISLIEMIEQGKIHRNQIPLSPELISTFLKYWRGLVRTDHRSDISLPFVHLTGDKFWHLTFHPDSEAITATGLGRKGVAAVRRMLQYASLDAELFDILKNPGQRITLLRVLIDSWFSGQGSQIEQLALIDEFESVKRQLLREGGTTYSVEDLNDEENIVVRNGAFRKIVVSLYEQRCAFCKLRIVSADGQNIVDGAHIKPFSEFRDDRFVNGLALCKNHHWAFDHGWFGIDDNFKVLIPQNRFIEESAVGSRAMSYFMGESIELPREEKFHPNLEALKWHRKRWDIV